MKAYSLDLRKKIIETYEQEEISQRELSKRFRVALSFIYKLLKQYREKGTLEPKGHGGGQNMKLSPDNIIVLGELVEQKNDATLEELREKLYHQTQVEVSSSTISRVLTSLELIRKKALHATERQTEGVQKLRLEYRQEISDEAEVNLDKKVRI